MDGDQGTPDTDMSIIRPFISLLVSQQPIINNKHITTMVTKGIKSIIQIKVCTRVKCLSVRVQYTVYGFGTSGIIRTKTFGQIE